MGEFIMEYQAIFAGGAGIGERFITVIFKNTCFNP
jgi:hypothetical protein